LTGRFVGRVCLVTGSTGIAEAAARALAAEGGHVYVVSRTADHARGLAEVIAADGGQAAWRAADLTQEAEGEAAVADCVEEFGRLDCVYNVAGISARRFGDGPLHEMTLEGWRAAIEVNATSTFLVCRAAVRQMLTRGGGVILNMSSALSRDPEPRFFATAGYAASKGAIEAFSRSIAACYGERGIRVNVIAPSLVATPMSERAQADAEVLAYVAKRQPLAHGPLQPEELVGTALYLLSDDSAMVTGQVIAVDGGWSVSSGSG
jgi:NAD(P)-dependent dehydrogenase (short-subunit alcohol dehydrogenase family)